MSKIAESAKTFINNKVDKIITRLGTSNDSEIVTASLAAFKLIFIPIATMADKKISKEQKEYTIKRDLLTESVALLGYIGITAQAKKLFTAPICAKYYKNKAEELLKNGKISQNSFEFKNLTSINPKHLASFALEKYKDTNDETNVRASICALQDAIKNINSKDNMAKIQMPKDLYLNTKKTISHLCVCTLALSVVPFVTNKILELISKSDKNKSKNPEKFSNFSALNKELANYKNNAIKKNTALTKMDIGQYMNNTRRYNNVIAY